METLSATTKADHRAAPPWFTIIRAMPNRWKPNVTVAALIEREGRFLLVEEETTDGLSSTTPQATWTRANPHAGLRPRGAGETAHDFVPTALVGVYLNRFTKTARATT